MWQWQREIFLFQDKSGHQRTGGSSCASRCETQVRNMLVRLTRRRMQRASAMVQRLLHGVWTLTRDTTSDAVGRDRCGMEMTLMAKNQ